MASPALQSDKNSFLSRYSRLLSGTVWNFLGTLFNQGSSFAINILVSRLLGRQAFGEYATVQTSLLALSGIAQVATGYTATKYVAEFRSTDKEKTGRIIGLLSLLSFGMALLVGGVVLAGSSWYAVHVLEMPNLVKTLMISSGVIFFLVMNGYLLGVLSGLEIYRPLSAILVISGTVYLLACGSLTYYFGVNGTFAGMLVSSLVQWLISALCIRSECRRQGIAVDFHSRNFAREYAAIRNFAAPSAISGLFLFSSVWIASVILTREGGAVQMALYSAANSYRMIILFIPNIINTVGLSILNHQKGARDRTSYEGTHRANTMMMMIATAMTAGFVFILKKFLLGTFGQGFVEGQAVFSLLILSTVFECFYLTQLQILQSHAKIWKLLAQIILPRESLFIALTYMLVPHYGAKGIAMAYLLAHLIGSAFIYRLTRPYRNGDAVGV